MRVPNPNEFETASPKWFSRFLGWLTGVESRRLESHSASAQTLIKAVGITMLFVSGPIAGAAMACYIYEHAIGLSFIARSAIACVGGLTWAFIAIVGVDRTLMVVSDSIGVGRRWISAFALVLRACLAALMASLFSGMLVEAQFSGISNEVAQHIALDVSEADANRIARIEGVPQARKLSSELETKASDLSRQYNTLPESIKIAQNIVVRCEADLRRLDRSLHYAMAAEANPDDIARAQIVVASKRVACRARLAEASRKKSAYLQPIAAEIATTNTARQVATRNLSIATETAATRTSQLDQATRDGYGSLSGRKIGFERAQQRYPEIRRSAQLWWLAFFAAELLPLLLKTLLVSNNPTAAEAQADLAEGAGHHRVRARRAAIVERELVGVLARPEVRAGIADAFIPYAIAIEHLAGHAAFQEKLVGAAARQSDFVRAHPDLAAQSYQAYAAAVANALDALSGRHNGYPPGE